MKYAILLSVLFFGACSIKEYEHTQPKIITLKSPKIKFFDAGYLRNTDKSVELELFIAGVSVEKIAVNRLVCTSGGCMSKSGFNKDYLHVSYPEDTIQNMLLGRPVYDGKNLQKSQNGFEQSINDGFVDIIYRVEGGEIYFKDRKNSILFKMKDVHE